MIEGVASLPGRGPDPSLGWPRVAGPPGPRHRDPGPDRPRSPGGRLVRRAWPPDGDGRARAERSRSFRVPERPGPHDPGLPIGGWRRVHRGGLVLLGVDLTYQINLRQSVPRTLANFAEPADTPSLAARRTGTSAPGADADHSPREARHGTAHATRHGVDRLSGPRTGAVDPPRAARPSSRADRPRNPAESSRGPSSPGPAARRGRAPVPRPGFARRAETRADAACWSRPATSPGGSLIPRMRPSQACVRIPSGFARAWARSERRSMIWRRTSRGDREASTSWTSDGS